GKATRDGSPALLSILRGIPKYSIVAGHGGGRDEQGSIVAGCLAFANTSASPLIVKRIELPSRDGDGARHFVSTLGHECRLLESSSDSVLPRILGSFEVI